MALRWYTVVVDSRDVRALSAWWANVLDWRVVYEADHEVVLVPPHALEERSQDIPLAERGPGLVFVSVPESKSVKNRLHIDLAPGPDDDQAAEVARLESLGASRINVGQDEATASWVVMADPEGNEFCVLSARGS